MKILVTGGAGYIGAVLCEHLLQAGHIVTVLDNMMYRQEPLWHLCHYEQFTFVRWDARDVDILADLVHETDVMIPLAAIVGASACDNDTTATWSTNCDAVQSMCHLKSDNQLLIYPNTNSGYGINSEGVCTEETPLNPLSTYGIAKRSGEDIVRIWENTVVFRLATVFGMSPRMRTDLLVNDFVYKAVTDGYLTIFEKDFRRNYVHVRDVADAFLFAIDNRERMAGNVYNLGLDSANLSKAELAEKVKEHVPNLHIHYAEVGSDPDKRNYVVSSQKLKDAGFEAKRTLDDGIRELVKGYRMIRGRHGNA